MPDERNDTPGQVQLGVDGVEDQLDAGHERELIGRRETQWLDFKGAPHDLSTQRGKWELAKDVAALANTDGGCLVIGLTTEMPSDAEEEVAQDVKPFPIADMSPKRHQDVLDGWVYPTLRGVTIRMFGRDADKAIGLIRVPRQDADDQPFIVVRMLDERDKHGIGIGVPLRNGPQTFWLPPGQLHRDLSDGRRSRRGAQAVREARPSSASSRPDVEELTSRRLEELEEFMGWGEAPTLMLAAVPTQPATPVVEGFFLDDGIYGAVQDPPQVRYAGFSLAWSAKPQDLGGSLINTVTNRSILRVDPDGGCFAAAAGTPAFLTRGGGSEYPAAPESRSINPTVLVEWTYLFCLFVERNLATSLPGDWTLVARLRGAKSREWTLRLGAGPRLDFMFGGQEARSDDWLKEWDATLDAGTDAYRLLSGVYSVFGLGPDAIPHVTDGRVDEQLLKAIR